MEQDGAHTMCTDADLAAPFQMPGPVRRFFCHELHGSTVTLDEAETRHALQVLRLSAGAEVLLLDGAGGVARGALRAAGKRQRTIEVDIVQRAQAPPPARALTLLVAGCKGARLDWLVEKCTELGVRSLVFAEFERSVVHVGENHLEKLQRTAIEACKQCGQRWLPQLRTGEPIDAAVRHWQRGPGGGPAAQLLLCHPHEQSPRLGRLLAGRALTAAAAIIGPEGGLSEGEAQRFMAAGAEPVLLADELLRVETAAVAVAAVFAAA